MTENIIYYGITIFFSLIALGVTWEDRAKKLSVKFAYIIIASISAISAYFLVPDLFAFLDIRYALGWSNDLLASEITDKRLRCALVQLIWFAVVGYLVCLYQLTIALNLRVTSQSTRTK